MGNTAVINTIGLNEYALEPMADGMSAFQHVLDYAWKLPEIDRVFCLCMKESPFLQTAGDRGAEPVIRGKWSVAEMLESIRENTTETDHIFYFFGDTPLLDLDLTKTMYGNHKKYFARYTFADGYPYGLAPEILSADLFPPLLQLEGGETRDIRRDAIFSVVQKDINSFEIETTLSPKDLRLLRVSLTADSRRDAMLLRSVIERGGKDAETVTQVLLNHPEILRTLPAFINVQVFGGCPQSCQYCPYPAIQPDLLTNKDAMPLRSFQRIIDEAAGFCGDAVIGLGLFGEPALHPQIGDLISAVLEKEGLSVLVETSGIGWDYTLIESFAGNGRISWIVSLDSLDQQVYNSLRGDGFFEAMETARLLLGLYPDQTWVQAVRMKKNEEVLESFFREWKKETEQVIIQKYDSFCGVLPDRKVADLSPVIRFPCWHIKRDVSVRLDGTIPMCRADVNNRYVLGNIFSEPLQKIWEKGDALYKEHIREKYNSQCEVCDEYYTYNF